MKQNNNFSVLPFYTDINLQNHRRSYSYGNVYPLLCPVNNILPFQIIREASVADVTKVEVYTTSGSLVLDITDEMRSTGLSIVKNAAEGMDVIVYTGYLPLATNMFCGQYYLTLSDGVNTFYSEVFTMCNNVDNLLKIEWYDLENFYMDDGVIIYQKPFFKNRLYFCAEIGRPSYPFEEEVEKRDGYTFPVKQISEKTYKFVILAPEYLLDVMRFIRMSDFVRITDSYGRKYDCDTFLMTPNWQKNGDVASVEIEFETDTIAKKIGGGYIKETKGDFNEDYQNDYNN